MKKEKYLLVKSGYVTEDKDYNEVVVEEVVKGSYPTEEKAFEALSRMTDIDHESHFIRKHEYVCLAPGYWDWEISEDYGFNGIKWNWEFNQPETASK